MMPKNGGMLVLVSLDLSKGNSAGGYPHSEPHPMDKANKKPGDCLAEDGIHCCVGSAH